MGKIRFDQQKHQFALEDHAENDDVLRSVSAPLSMIVQVTRRCVLRCSFCSESEDFADPDTASLMALRKKLKGIRRVYLSGGEPLLRQDIFDLLRAYRDDFEVVGLPTSCTTIDRSVAKRLEGLVHYINAGLDGPRAMNNRVRGNYDDILRGILNLRDSGLEVSLSTVVLTSTLPYLPYVVQVADTVGATKVKMALPVLRGRAKTLPQSEFTNKDDTVHMFEKLVQLKRELGWKPSIKLALWDPNTEGYALLVYPNQQVYAWPVYDALDGVMHVGDLSKQNLEQIWHAYPFKKNHVNKYVGRTTYNG